MVKKILSVVAAAAIAVTALTGAMFVSAEDGTTADGFVYTSSKDGIIITGYTGAGGDITIPSEIDGTNVYSIQHESFMDNTTITSVKISEGISRIEYYAFRGCTSIKSVVIPSTMTDWYPASSPNGNSNTYCMFGNCTSLTDVTFTDGLKKIGPEAFIGCENLKEVNIPKSVVDIEGAFSGLTTLERVNFAPDSEMTMLGYNCFRNTAITEITLPESLTEIGANAFNGCSNLAHIRVPDNVVTLQSGVFINCTSLKTVELSKSLKNMSTYIFYNDKKLTAIYIYSKNVNYVEKSAIPDGVEVYVPSGSTTENTLKGFSNITIRDIQEHPNHEFTEVILKEATCTEAGEKLCTCTLCNLRVTEEIPSGHKYADGVCSVCGEKDPNYIPPTSNNPTVPSNPSTPTNKPTVPSNPSTAINEPTVPSAQITTASTKSQAQKKAEKVMKQAKITKLTVKSKAKNKITVTWKKVSNAKGYEVEVSAKKNFKKAIVSKTTTKKKLTIKNKKLKSKKTYYVRVRAYATYKAANGNLQKVYSSWNKKLRKVKVK